MLNDVYQQSCVFCFTDIETVRHLFVDCPKTKEIWKQIFSWMNWNIAGWEEEVIENFLVFNTICNARKRKQISFLGSQQCGVCDWNVVLLSLMVK